MDSQTTSQFVYNSHSTNRQSLVEVQIALRKKEQDESVQSRRYT